jgi:hypothetical protein
LVAAQAIESNDLSQPGVYFPPAFGVDFLAQASDLESLLEGRLLIFTKEDMDCMPPGNATLSRCLIA